MANQPIKRHEVLKPLSREHHEGLLLCWKIKEGFRQGISAARIKEYTDWFWHTHLIPHFEAEEKWLFPILPPGDELVQQALGEHQRLKKLFEQASEINGSLRLIATELDDHIRFEERILFNRIQQVASPGQLQLIGAHHRETVCDDWPDEFWKSAER